ncbi:MAG: membrane dipeptidase [Deltaproteobacteria bacterium]|nr:membrane dipeptidase [Nannocystaceae bacterium]
MTIPPTIPPLANLLGLVALGLFSGSCLDIASPSLAVERLSDATRPELMSASLAPAAPKGGKASKKLEGGYVLTHEHPTQGMAFGGNYAFAGGPGNYENGVMEKGYHAECGGCKAGKKCDHGEAKGNFTAALGALGSDMGDHKSSDGPAYDSFSHLRYSTEWVRAAYDPPGGKAKGLKIMVALAVENEAMCEQLYYANKGNGGPGGDGYACTHGDSVKSMDRQIVALKGWVKANSSWMAIAYDAEDARRIVESGKLAIVLGVESEYAFGAEDRTFDPVSRLDHYYDIGVRTFYLAHKINSRLAGADIYRDKGETGGKVIRANQAMAGCFYVDDAVAGFPLKNEDGHKFCDNTCGKGGFKAGKPTDKCVMKYSELSETNYASLFLGHGDDYFNGFKVYPKPPGFSGAAGSREEHGVERNNLGLSHDGERVVRAAMRYGMILNLDHVSSRSRKDIDLISADFDVYPMNALHNNPNDMLVANGGKLDTPGPNEYDFDKGELGLVKKSHGFFGLRVGPVDAKDYPKSGVTTNCPKTATEAAKILAYLIDEGLDVGYSLDYATVTQGVHSRTFANCGRTLGGGKDHLHKYGEHIAKGLTHIGMMTSWHDELKAVGLADKYMRKLENDGPEAFIQMWERSEAKSKKGEQIPRKTFTADVPSDGKPRGSMCTSDKQCKTDRCSWGVCADKDECRDDGDCSSSQYCGDPIGGKASCKALKAKGDGCTKKEQCATNRCSWGFCAAEDECRSNSDCSGGQYCGDPIGGKASCKALRGKGEGCTKKAQCKSNQCSWGSCK